ncbi:hypothetical protein [Kineococcus radiotolerans]|uniref:Ig-like domain-containing protein n=1 Tax=Kineococcus radiotolerans (strain ATCC BAA-149 / DSM 14245 / SRS30216) TaxID=266940 RepID=A6WG08_KINRD|nr:hypothetical protein [Kineococcus radiotolerans]ABS05747.1 hypothetical protein Krad_4284 [Kineococcus radiotolerans SRS30216 = ATCC BAA-149]
MTARPSVRTRHLRWSGALLGAALAAAAVAAPAEAATTPAMTWECGKGSKNASQLSTAGARSAGPVVVTARGAAKGAKALDRRTGKVLACTAKSAPAPRPTSAAPANDRMGAAEPIGGLPFTTTVDTAGADADGPQLKNYERCELSNESPVQTNTVWYSYRPAATGPAPQVSVAPASGWAQGNTHGDWAQQAGILEVLPGGSTRLVENADDWDCESPVTLTAGATYLIGVYYGSDAYNDTVPVSGGPVRISVTNR